MPRKGRKNKKVNMSQAETVERKDKEPFQIRSPETPRFDVDEVIIYSSSHMSYKRGLRKLLLEKLGDKFHVIIRAHGGRTWDDGVADAYRGSQGEGKSHQKLHVILLGDNDVRGRPKGAPKAKFNEIDPTIQRFGETVKYLSQTDKFKGDTIFVNGILPFPFLESQDAPRLIENFYFYTNSLSSLIDFSPTIHYVPMRSKAIEFCVDNAIEIDELFRRDKVHLNEVGERFLAEHLTTQINAFRCSKRFGVRFDCLRFDLEIVNAETEDELERHFKISVDTNFSNALQKLDFISNENRACFEAK